MKTITLDEIDACSKCGWTYEHHFQRRVLQDDKGFYIGTSCECGIHAATEKTFRYVTCLDADKALHYQNLVW